MAGFRTSRVVGIVGISIAAVVIGGACASEVAPSTCGDHQRDGSEIGVDCGGACGKCTGQSCSSPDECKSGACTQRKCAPPGGKVCGVGVGASCEDGSACELDDDCTSKTCLGAKCVPPGTSAAATDGKKDNGETDVDCGGAKAPPCADGKTCGTNDDCTGKYCSGGKCATPTTTDGVKNGTETDVDCGGQSGVKCGDGKACVADGDCTGACNYANKCDAPSCKTHLGGDTCGTGEVGEGGAQHESCCKTLEVKTFQDPAKPGKKVFLDKYEITAGRVRAFIAGISAKQAGKPDVKGWLAANAAPVWNAGWTKFLPSDTEAENITLPNATLGNGVASPANVGQFYAFGAIPYVYVHGQNCYQGSGSYGFPTYWYPPTVMAKNDGLPRLFSQDVLDVKSMTCIPNAVLAAFCHWDGGQLATDEVLDFVTGSPLGRSETDETGAMNEPACGCTTNGCQNRCPKTADVNATFDAGDSSDNYYFPTEESPQQHEGVQRISAPGRVVADRVQIGNDEPWADLGGNLNEVAIDTTGGVTQGRFTLRYRGIGFKSARAAGNRGNGDAQNPIGTTANPARFSLPEYKAGYSGGRCMRYRD